MALGLVHDLSFADHDPGSYHPESPLRIKTLDAHLQSWPGRAQTRQIPLRPATSKELLLIHRKEHLSRIASTEDRTMSLDPDTVTSPDSYRLALRAVGSLIDLCDACLDGEVQNGAALVRPPGHHATPQRAMGFCLFNNVAIAAAHLVKDRGLERVMVVDWDVHHGNGTEDCFYDHDYVLYFSTHQAPFYPGSGQVGATGGLEAKGYNINVPLPGGQGDLDFIRVFEDLLVPVAEQYKPQFILLSGGFDGHKGDPLGGMRITSRGFAAMTQVLMEISQKHCPGCLVMALEGGYNPEAQARAIVQVMEVMQGAGHGQELRRQAQGHPQPDNLKAAMAAAGAFWDVG